MDKIIKYNISDEIIDCPYRDDYEDEMERMGEDDHRCPYLIMVEEKNNKEPIHLVERKENDNDNM